MKNIKNAHMGDHLLAEVYNVPFDKLNDAKKIEQVCESACKTEGLEVLNTYVPVSYTHLTLPTKRIV